MGVDWDQVERDRGHHFEEEDAHPMFQKMFELSIDYDCEADDEAIGRRALGATRGRNNNQQAPAPSRSNTSSPSSYGQLGPPSIPPTPASPSLSSAMTVNEQTQFNHAGQRKVPLFFREDYATFIVKGNFMTLAAKPLLIEEGEWMSHQIVEQNRLLSGMIKCVQGDERTGVRSVCNEQSCQAMAAGATTYTWIDTNRNPINLPATIYIKHIQTWVNGKIQDPTLFPTDTFTIAPPLPNPAEAAKDPNHWLGKTSGFPQRFETEIKNMYKQMFRCYAHLYWQHWLTFWELSAHRELNTCFVHFMNVGRIYNLLNDKDIEPMLPLVELWVKQGVLPGSTAKTEKTESTNSGSAPAAPAAPSASTSGLGAGGSAASPALSSTSGSGSAPPASS